MPRENISQHKHACSEVKHACLDVKFGFIRSCDSNFRRFLDICVALILTLTLTVNSVIVIYSNTFRLLIYRESAKFPLYLSFTRLLSSVTRLLLVCTRLHSSVTRLLLVCTRLPLVCTRLPLVCHSSVFVCHSSVTRL